MVEGFHVQLVSKENIFYDSKRDLLTVDLKDGLHSPEEILPGVFLDKDINGELAEFSISNFKKNYLQNISIVFNLGYVLEPYQYEYNGYDYSEVAEALGIEVGDEDSYDEVIKNFLYDLDLISDGAISKLVNLDNNDEITYYSKDLSSISLYVVYELKRFMKKLAEEEKKIGYLGDVWEALYKLKDLNAFVTMFVRLIDIMWT